MPMPFSPCPDTGECTDQSVETLRHIFGPVVDSLVSGTDPGTVTAASSLLGTLFSVFNSGVLVVGSLIVSYVAVVGVINTANDGDSLGFRWPGPSLLHRLLLDSRLSYGGSGEKWRTPSGVAGEDHPGAALADAVNRGNVGGFINAMDDLVTGPDELTLLVAWALLHLWRPF